MFGCHLIHEKRFNHDLSRDGERIISLSEFTPFIGRLAFLTYYFNQIYEDDWIDSQASCSPK